MHANCTKTILITLQMDIYNQDSTLVKFMHYLCYQKAKNYVTTIKCSIPYLHDLSSLKHCNMKKADIDCHDSKIGGIIKMTANIRKFENIMLASHRTLGNRINNTIHFLSNNKIMQAEITKRAMKMLSKIQKDSHCKLLCDVTDTLFLSGSVNYIVAFWQNLLVGWWWDSSPHFPI